MAKVFRKILKENRDVQLMLVGSGEENYVKNFLSSIEKEIETGRIKYQPRATQIELASIYKSADLFLFTSNYEIFGMVLLEAMYFGLPVLSSENGGSVTLIEQGVNGYVMEGFHADEWVRKIVDLIHYEAKRKEMGGRAAKTVKEKYLWGSLAGRFLSVYQEAIDKR